MFSWCFSVFTLFPTFLHLLSRNLLKWEQFDGCVSLCNLVSFRTTKFLMEHAMLPQTVVQRRFRLILQRILVSCVAKKFCYCLFPCWIWYLPLPLLLRTTFFVHTWEFLTFVHRRWFSLKHVSVEHRAKNEKRSEGKNDEFFLQNKKTSFIAFYQFKFISFLSWTGGWKERRTKNEKWNWE